MGKGKNNKHYKLSKLFSLLLILIMATTDVAPLVSVAVDTIKGDNETVEEIAEEDEKDEKLELEIEDGALEDGDIELEEEEIELELEDEEFEGESETEDFIEEPQQTDKGIAMMSMSTQSTPTYVMATDADFSGTSNGNFRYLGKGGYVEIPHTIKGVNVTSYANMFGNRGQGVQGVKSTNKNVVNMSGMFSDFRGSYTLDVSQLDTSNVTNMAYMFQGTTHGQNNIRAIIGLENFNTIKVSNFDGMFWRSAVKDLRVYNFDTSRASNMYRMFGDSWAENIDVRGFNTSNVVDMRQMFHLTRTKNLDLSSFNTSNVADMSQMFYNAQTTDLTLGGNFNTSRVEDMNYMFRGTTIQNLDLTGFDTSNVVDMSYMFMDANFKSIDLSGFDTSKVTRMISMFENSQATNINLGGKFNTSKVTTMNSMFRGSKATSLDLTKFDTSNVTDMIYMFRDSNASNINLGENFNTSKVEKMSRMFAGSNVDSLDLTGFDTRNVTDMEMMFSYSDIRELNLSSFNTSRITDMSGMFLGAKVEILDVSNFDTTYVTDMSRMFENSSLRELDLSSFDMKSVNNTEDMFKGSSITKVKARTRDDENKLNKTNNKPDGITFKPLYEIAQDSDFSGFLNGQFKYTGNYEYVEIPHTIKGINVNSYKDMFSGTGIKGVFSTNPNVTDMSGMFKNTTSDAIDVLSINTENVTNMSGMFEGSRVIEMNLSRFNTSKVTNMSNMFRNTKLKEIDLGSFDLTKVSNTNNMFNGADATKGYARTQQEVSKLNSSTNKPTGLRFSVWGITTTQSNDNWTNKPIDLTINAVSGDRGIDYVEMVNETGRNYALNSATGGIFNTNNSVTSPVSTGFDSNIGARWIYGRRASTNRYFLNLYVNSAYVDGRGTRYSEDLYPVPDTLTYSIDVMSPYPIKVGFREGNMVTLVPNQWTRITKTGTSYGNRPEGLNVPEQGNIPLNTRLYYKNFKIEKGTEATPWKPAPEDSDSSSEQTDKFPIYNNGTYIFRATDTSGETKIVSHTVTNIDTTQPTAKLTKSTTGQTSQDVEIYVNAEDDLSGVDYITMPDGSKVSGDKATYIAKDNGKYEFKITDKAGNTTKYTEEVNNIDRSLVVVTATVDNTDWTRDPVNITVTSEESASKLLNIEMVNSPIEGRNLLKGTEFEEGKEEWYLQTSSQGMEGNYEIIELEGGGNAIKVNITESGSTMDVSIKQKIMEGIKERKLTLSWGILIVEGDINLYANMRTVNEQGEYSMYRDNTKSLREGYPTRIYNTETIEEGETIDQIWLRTNPNNEGETGYTVANKPKLEVGDLTPWTPAPEDIRLINNSKTYPVVANGLYTFKASYENGVTSEVSVNVTNIDLDAPTIEVNNNPEDWIEDDEIELEITALDDKSGVKSITLPDGTEVKSNKATYKVSENGDYEFIVMDNVGNVTTHTETVDRMMMQYGFYIYDSNNKPLEGADFELLVDGGVFKEATSDKEGYVDFGKVPPAWKYTIRQVSSPDGSVLPGDIEVEDPTDPVEVVNYPRGTEMPSTGTIGAMITVIMVTLIGISLYINRQNKHKINIK